MDEPRTAPAKVENENTLSFHAGSTAAGTPSEPRASAEFEVTTHPVRYTLGPEIAHGGMGAIHRAIDERFQREVAVKVLLQKYDVDSHLCARFTDEARITGQLQHPAIPPVHDHGILPDGRPFLVMKLIQGDTLQTLLRGRSTPTEHRGRFVAVFEQICQAVAYAHARGIIHRDLKPGNVMVGSFGEVQVMDWGLAKDLNYDRPSTKPGYDDAPPTSLRADDVTAEYQPRSTDGLTYDGQALGTPSFMPPEQAQGAVNRIDRRSDVFALGGILAMILTGFPPYSKNALPKAIVGDLSDTMGRLDACSADPDLVLLCRSCLAVDRDARPADASEVAKTVAGLRQAAEERAQKAEVNRVRTEGERQALLVQANEQRKRRRVWIGAASALTFTAIAGLSAVLFVQNRARTDLTKKNNELSRSQSRLIQSNQELTKSQLRVEDRFKLAVNAIEAFHTGVSEDFLLKQEQFAPLRQQLLSRAAGFYGELDDLLREENDIPSRRALAAGYFQLGSLVDKIGSKPEAIEVHRQALAVRRKLASQPDADLETQLDVARSLRAIAILLWITGDPNAAQLAFEEAKQIASKLVDKGRPESARAVLAQALHGIGILKWRTGDLKAALAAFDQASSFRTELASAHPENKTYQRELADTFNALGAALSSTEDKAGALSAYEKARIVRERLAKANPDQVQHQSDLAQSFFNIGVLHAEGGQRRAAVDSLEEARKIQHVLVTQYPAVSSLQLDLVQTYNALALHLSELNEFSKAIAYYDVCRPILEQLVASNPEASIYQEELGELYSYIGLAQANPANPGRNSGLALASYNRALEIHLASAAASPEEIVHQDHVAMTKNNIGRLYGEERQFDLAFAALDDAQQRRQQKLTKNPESLDARLDLGETHLDRAKVNIFAERWMLAASDLWAAVKLLDGDVGMQFECARANALLAGLAEKPQAGVTPEQAKICAEKSMAQLADLKMRGLLVADPHKAPDFAALRNREDFQKLMAPWPEKPPGSSE